MKRYCPVCRAMVKHCSYCDQCYGCHRHYHCRHSPDDPEFRVEEA